MDPRFTRVVTLYRWRPGVQSVPSGAKAPARSPEPSGPFASPGGTDPEPTRAPDEPGRKR